MRRKNFSVSTRPGGFKGTPFQKNQMGDIYLLSMDNLKIKFFGYL
jgi:hypothetical protein